MSTSTRLCSWLQVANAAKCLLYKDWLVCCISMCVSCGRPACKACSLKGLGGACKCSMMHLRLSNRGCCGLLLLPLAFALMVLQPLQLTLLGGPLLNQGFRDCNSVGQMLAGRPGRLPPASSRTLDAWGYADAAAVTVSARRGLLAASCHRLCGMRIVLQKLDPRRCFQSLQTSLHARTSASDTYVHRLNLLTKTAADNTSAAGCRIVTRHAT